MESERIVREARRRQEIFKNLQKYLSAIKETVREKVDRNAEIYLFGSVAEGTHLYSSDIDVLVVSDVKSEKVRVALWEVGIEDPFEILVLPKDKLEDFRRRATLVPVS